jgi:hypothetical protein
MENVTNNSPIKHCIDLQNDLLNMRDRLARKEISNDDLKTFDNNAGKILAVCKVMLEHNKLTGIKSKIPFLTPGEENQNQ